MSEDSTESGKRISRRKALGILAAGALTTTGILTKPEVRVGASPKHTELPSLTSKVTEIKDDNRQKLLDHLRKSGKLESTVSDYQVATFSIKSFVIHLPSEETQFYPKFAILPPIDQSRYLPRIIMEREEQLVPLREDIAKFENGIKIISWSTSLVDKTKPDIRLVSKTNSSETIFKYYNGTISSNGEHITDRNLSQICYFPADFLLNRGIPQSMRLNNSSNKEGHPINLNTLPELAQDYLTDNVLAITKNLA